MLITSKQIGLLLQEIRNDHHYTLRQVSDLYGKDNSTISKWETGDSKISAVELSSYLDFYGVDIDDFFLRLCK